jgi:outer membrane protein assembly factor BamB
LKLYRLKAADGSIIWSTNLVEGFGGYVIAWQNAASPVIEDGRVFVNANSPSASLMAFDATNGTLIWRSQNEAMTQSTPTIATINGIRQVIFATQSGLVSVNPQTGSLIWKTNYPFSYSTSIGASPVVGSNYIFLSANYSMSGFVVQIIATNGAQVPVQRWNSTIHRSHWSTPVYYQGSLFGTFYPDHALAELRCVDLASGASRWTASGFGRGGVMLVGTNLLVSTERGDLALVAAKTNSFAQLARFQAIPGYRDDGNKCWNALALSDGQVYIRSTAYAARFDLSVPELKLDAPKIAAGKLDLTIRTATGTPVDSNRLTGMEVRASTNAVLSPVLWTKLTNSLTLTNGVVSVTNVVAPPPRFFIVSEPK